MLISAWCVMNGANFSCSACNLRHSTPLSNTVMHMFWHCLLTDTSRNIIRKVDLQSPYYNMTKLLGTGTSTNLGDGGLATSATTSRPTGLAVAPSGEIYFSTK